MCSSLALLPSSIPFLILWGNPSISTPTGPILHRLTTFSTTLPPTVSGLELWFRNRDPIRVGDCHFDSDPFGGAARRRTELVLDQGRWWRGLDVRAGGWVQGVN